MLVTDVVVSKLGLQALGWDVADVCHWLQAEGIGQLCKKFRGEAIDGPVLLSLDDADLYDMAPAAQPGLLGSVRAKVAALRAAENAGPAPADDNDDAEIVDDDDDADDADGYAAFGEHGHGRPRSRSASPPPPPPGKSTDASVLDAVLQENAGLQQQLDRLRARHSVASVPRDDFLCPILKTVMEDPVVARDGFTYERAAILAWLVDHDTSPLTREHMSRVVYPNKNLRSQIDSWSLAAGRTPAPRPALPAVGPGGGEKQILGFGTVLPRKRHKQLVLLPLVLLQNDVHSVQFIWHVLLVDLL